MLVNRQADNKRRRGNYRRSKIMQQQKPAFTLLHSREAVHKTVNQHLVHHHYAQKQRIIPRKHLAMNNIKYQSHPAHCTGKVHRNKQQMQAAPVGRHLPVHIGSYRHQADKRANHRRGKSDCLQKYMCCHNW